jgi:hypothetical protein
MTHPSYLQAAVIFAIIIIISQIQKSSGARFLPIASPFQALLPLFLWAFQLSASRSVNRYVSTVTELTTAIPIPITQANVQIQIIPGGASYL